jgi:hypothetical protein
MMGVPYNDPNTPPLELSINPISNAPIAIPNTTHAHCERSAGHIFECQLVIFCLLITGKECVSFS